MNTGIKVVLMIVAGALLTVTGLAQEREVVINEVAWGGSREDPTGEWIELFNSTDHAISLEGWCLVSSDGSPDILRHGKGSGLYFRIFFASATRFAMTLIVEKCRPVCFATSRSL
ncbi:lamin tail domain-containing protein [Candidatus Bipolaricaulota bacterium]|nr:lamin tail domain-containing protein [Candidatus Bipolaricaulota bacterium]